MHMWAHPSSWVRGISFVIASWCKTRKANKDNIMFALNPCVWRRKDSQNTTAGETLVQAHAGANTWCKHTLVQAHVCPRVFPMVMTLAFSNRNDKHSISNVLFYTLLIRTILGMHRSAINWESQQSTPGRSGHNRVARPATTAHCAVELFPYLAETISL